MGIFLHCRKIVFGDATMPLSAQMTPPKILTGVKAEGVKLPTSNVQRTNLSYRNKIPRWAARKRLFALSWGSW